ncbi:MAG: EamA family transporter [Gammaproteobacteria bacterium]|nr:EamA family transporter [Gammaproteobacteria bacterium]
MEHDAAWRTKVIIAFAAVYIIWGSTYLAIRVGVQQLPPVLFAGSRFVVAGILLALYARWRGQKFPTEFREWRTIAISGLLMLFGANGLVVWGEQWVTSNQAALIVATVALWLAGFGTIGSSGQKLGARTVLGLTIGFFGVALLMMPERGFSLEHFGAQLAVFAACPLWAAGSMVAKRGRLTTAPLMVAAMQSLIAGLVFCGIGFPLGEAARWSWSREALAALGFLIVFGSCFAFAAYVWLLHEVSPAALGTYAYINPLVAVVLGWVILQEALSGKQLAGMVVILIGVILVSIARPKAIAAPSLRT